MVDSLKIQDVSYELIGLDNQDGHFPSAAVALNYGANKASGDVLVFLHQDILFDNSSGLSSLTDPKYFEQPAIIGLFGASHGKSRQVGENLWSAETLDECCIAMRKTIWQEYCNYL